MRDNAHPNDAGKKDVTFASIKEGKVVFTNSDFTVQLSEEEFTHVAFVFHFGSNAIDVYVNGVMRAKDIVFTTATDAVVASFVPHEFRILQPSSVNNPNTWIDLASAVVYSGSFPAAFTDVALDGVIADYSGTILDETFDDDYVIDPENVKIDGDASVAENVLVVKAGTSVEFVVDPLKRNSTYIITVAFKGNANNMKSGALLTGIKSNFYGETLYEDILTVDADGDILFYNQIIGNTAEDMVIEIAVNEDSKVLDLYVNGEYIASGWYTNAEYCKTEDTPYVIGYKFGCATGEYAIDYFTVVTGIYEG